MINCLKKNIKSFSIYLFFVLFTYFSCENIYSQNHQLRYNSIDVLNYKFELTVNDSSDVIYGIATVKISFKTELDNFYLDLKNTDETGFGMSVDEIFESDKKASYTHRNDKIEFSISKTQKGEIREYKIKYHGIPKDGLIISKNIYNERVFFGDNWPNRAFHWLPTVDHPSDKALVEFIVKAPNHYQVVSNGSLIEEINMGSNIISHWQTKVPLPTKLMVVGIARFARQNLANPNNIPVSSWVYPQFRDEGFKEYSIALKPLDYYTSYLAPFPFSKLANVQSKTIYGGMENASCIFYSEDTLKDKQYYELIFAHEIAHQWLVMLFLN